MITISQLLAIDAGGTSTRAMVLTPYGECLGVGHGGRGNPVSAGPGAAAEAISTAVAAAIRHLRSGSIDAVTVAMAGGSVANPPSQWLARALGRLGISVPIGLEHDLHAIFASGTPQLAGYALVAGTGATAVRVHDGDVVAVADGLGWLLGDSGSGFWIGHQVARAVAADLDGRGPATTMTPAVLERLQAGTDPVPPRTSAGRERSPDLDRLVTATYAQSPLRLARLAPIAFTDPDDPVAARIVDDASLALARAVADLAVPDLAGPLVLGGGVCQQERVRDRVVAQVRSAGVTGPVHTVPDGLVGAGVIALRRAGLKVTEDVFDRLSTTTAHARAETTTADPA